MKILKVIYLSSVILVYGCGSGGNKTETKSDEPVESEPTKVEEESIDLDNKGIGPVTELSLGELDQGMAEEGKKLFETYCVACHKPEEDFIGPAPKDILKKRSPEWVMNMVLNPAEMTQKDPIAKRLLEEANNVPMIGQGLTEEQARKILEYFRTL